MSSTLIIITTHIIKNIPENSVLDKIKIPKLLVINKEQFMFACIMLLVMI